MKRGVRQSFFIKYTTTKPTGGVYSKIAKRSWMNRFKDYRGVVFIQKNAERRKPRGFFFPAHPRDRNFIPVFCWLCYIYQTCLLQSSLEKIHHFTSVQISNCGTTVVFVRNAHRRAECSTWTLISQSKRTHSSWSYFPCFTDRSGSI